MLIKKLSARTRKPRTMETVLYASFSVQSGASFYADAVQGTPSVCTVEEAVQAILADELSAGEIFDAICMRYNALEIASKK